MSPNANYRAIISTQTSTNGLVHLMEFHGFFLPLLYGTFTSSITLLRAEFDTTPFLLNELESRFIGLCYCALVAGAAAAEVSAARCRGHG